MNDTVSLSYVEAGSSDDPLLVLLHGFPESARAWRKTMRPLAERGFHVVAPDMRGYGDSDAPAGIAAYAIDRLVDDVVALADRLGKRMFALVGHDWGGLVAWAVAARHPERLRHLVILNAPHPDTAGTLLRHPTQILRSWYVGFFQIAVLPERLLSAFHYRALRRSLLRTSRPGSFAGSDVAAYVDQWSRPGRLTAMINYYRALRLPRRPLGRITVPTRILWGQRDRFLGEHLAVAAAAMCDQAQIVRFPNDTHWLHHESPRQVVTEIARFVA